LKIYLIFILSIISQNLLSQDIVCDNMIYDQRVQSVVFTKASVDDRYPIITLGSNEKLELGFDVMGSENEFFQYTLIHCDANWKPTPMQQSEYIIGVTFDNINDWKFSNNTFHRYVHYSLVLPRENMTPLISGNYLLKVYRNFDETDLVLTRRVLVLKSMVSISAKVAPSTLAKYRYTKQEISFIVNHKGFTIVDPYNDVKAVILQNNRWDNAITDIKPQFVRDQTIEYNDFEKCLFPGGNEFRWFDFRSLRQVSPNVRSKTFDSIYHLYLNYEESRGSNQYFYYLDNNGRRVIENRDGVDVRFDGDYAEVNFYLLTMNPVQDNDVYVLGEFTDWKMLPEYKMSYNSRRSRYELTTKLKQGRYEYMFAIKDQATQKPDETYFEGSFSGATNDYLILIYHRNIQYNYDELIGTSRVSVTF
jgi:hypothetical protein